MIHNDSEENGSKLFNVVGFFEAIDWFDCINKILTISMTSFHPPDIDSPQSCGKPTVHSTEQFLFKGRKVALTNRKQLKDGKFSVGFTVFD